MLTEDTSLRRWFSEEEITTMREAIEDHRASSSHLPRTIYGLIVAEADRQIVPEVIVRRTVQYSLAHHPSFGREEHWERCLGHLHEKYYYGGYLKLYIPESENATRLEELRKLIARPEALRALFDRLYDELTVDGRRSTNEKQ